MAASGIQANWTGATHGADAVADVQSCTISDGKQLTAFSAGIDRYKRKHAALMAEPSIQITSSDVAKIMSLTGTKDFSITLKDAFGASGGDILYAGENATPEGASTNGSHATFASASVTLRLASDDGATNPLSFTRA